MTQRPFPPRVGFVGEVEPEPHGAFPTDVLGRIRWAMSAPVESPPAKTVAMILAVFADRDGKAWPSLETIAKCASLSRRAAINAVNRLEDDGWLTVYKRRSRPSLYWLKRPADRHCRGCWYVRPARVRLCPSCGREGVHEVHRRVHEVHPKTLLRTKG